MSIKWTDHAFEQEFSIAHFVQYFVNATGDIAAIRRHTELVTALLIGIIATQCLLLVAVAALAVFIMRLVTQCAPAVTPNGSEGLSVQRSRKKQLMAVLNNSKPNNVRSMPVCDDLDEDSADDFEQELDDDVLSGPTVSDVPVRPHVYANQTSVQSRANRRQQAAAGRMTPANQNNWSKVRQSNLMKRKTVQQLADQVLQQQRSERGQQTGEMDRDKGSEAQTRSESSYNLPSDRANRPGSVNRRTDTHSQTINDV